MEVVGTIITILRVVDFSVAKMTSLEWSWMIDWYLTSLEILGISKWLQVFFFFFNLWNSLQIKVFLWNSSILTKFYFYLSKIGSHKSALVKRIVGNTLRKRQHFCSWKDLDVVRWGRKFLWFFLKKGSMFSSIDLYIENVVF